VETRLVPDAPGAWLVYDLGTLVFALPPEFRAAADAIAALPPAGVAGLLAALTSSGLPAAPFAVVDAAGADIHVALRGPATLAAGEETLTGLGAEPWLERLIPGAGVVRLTVPGGEWTLTLAPRAPAVRTPAPRVPVPRVTENTEVPDASVPPPPRLGLVEQDGPPASTVAPPAPRAALSLELPDGSREPLDATLLVGRAPSAGVAGRVVQLEGDGDISRNHARVDVEGGTVVVTDLGSRNGTIVRIPGRPAQKLRDGEPTPVLVGTVIDLGGGFELVVRED
jgi:hypothetical protein